MSNKKNQLRKEIADLINSIKEHSDQIGDKPHIAQLELQVILQKIEKLYEHSIIYNYLHSLPDDAEPVVNNPVATDSPAIETPAANDKKQKQAVIDLFSEESPNTSAPDKGDTTLSGKFQQSKIDNLKAAIGINEKFQFINELFDGNTNEYNAAVDQLNAFADSENANIYLNNLQGIYHWNMDNPVIRNFMDLVKRRFM